MCIVYAPINCSGYFGKLAVLLSCLVSLFFIKYFRMRLSFSIPTEAVPACIGHNGRKHRDTEGRTKTKIVFADSSSDVMTLVSVEGSPADCETARTLINMAVGHCLASLKETGSRPHTLDETHATLDIKTVLFEIFRA